MRSQDQDDETKAGGWTGGLSTGYSVDGTDKDPGNAARRLKNPREYRYGFG